MTIETRNFIIDRAQQLFYRYGIRSITMDFIASELGMSKRTLYENFKNKEALIVACMEKGRHEQEKEMSQIFNSSANTLEKLVRCYSRIIFYLNKTSRSFLLDVAQMHNSVNEEVEKHRQKQHLYIRDILNMGVKDELIRSDINIDIATVLHNNQMEWLCRTKNDLVEEWRLGDIMSTMVMIFLYGIVTDKGRKVLDDNYELITQTL